MTFVHFTSRPSGVVIPSAAKNPSTGSGQVSLRDPSLRSGWHPRRVSSIPSKWDSTFQFFPMVGKSRCLPRL